MNESLLFHPLRYNALPLKPESRGAALAQLQPNIATNSIRGLIRGTYLTIVTLNLTFVV